MNLQFFNISDAYDLQGNYNSKVNVNKSVAEEMATEAVIFDLKDLDATKSYEFTIGFVPWVRTVFWKNLKLFFTLLLHRFRCIRSLKDSSDSLIYSQWGSCMQSLFK